MFRNEYRLIKKAGLYAVQVRYFLIPFWFTLNSDDYLMNEKEADEWLVYHTKRKAKKEVIKYYS